MRLSPRAGRARSPRRGYGGAYADDDELDVRRGQHYRYPAERSYYGSPVLGLGSDERSPHSHTEVKDMRGTHGLRDTVHASHRHQGAEHERHTTYIVATYTGTIDAWDKSELWWDAANDHEALTTHTEAAVFITLRGSSRKNSAECEHRLVHAGPDVDHIFQPGSMDEFVIHCPDLGDIEGVELRVAPRHALTSPWWPRNLYKVDKVAVTCLQHQHPTRTGLNACFGCCGNPAKGDHVHRTTTESSNHQWHFVAPHDRKWVGEVPGMSYQAYQDQLVRVEQAAKEAIWEAERLENAAARLRVNMEVILVKGSNLPTGQEQNKLRIPDEVHPDAAEHAKAMKQALKKARKKIRDRRKKSYPAADMQALDAHIDRLVDAKRK